MWCHNVISFKSHRAYSYKQDIWVIFRGHWTEQKQKCSVQPRFCSDEKIQTGTGKLLHWGMLKPHWLIRFLMDQWQRKTFLAQVKRHAICSWFIPACMHLSPLLWMVTWLLTNQPRASVFWKIKLSPYSAFDINFNEDKTGMAQPGTIPYSSAVQSVLKVVTVNIFWWQGRIKQMRVSTILPNSSSIFYLF